MTRGSMPGTPPYTPGRSFTVSGLQADTMYDIRVRVCAGGTDADGEFADANCGEWFGTGARTARLNPPTAITTRAETTTKIFIEWTPLERRSPAARTRIQYQTQSDAPWTLAGDTGVGHDVFSVTGLTANTGYTFRLRHCETAGDSTIDVGDPCGDWSATFMETTRQFDFDPPQPPRNFRADVAGGGATLHWEAPSSDGGSPITRYEYRSKTGSGNYGSPSNLGTRATSFFPR